MPSPRRARNFPTGVSGPSGSSSWIQEAPAGPSATRSIASRTPWPSWISRLTTLSSNTVSQNAILAARSWQAIPTWSIRCSTAASLGGLAPSVSWQTSCPGAYRGPGGAVEGSMPEAVITAGGRTAIGRLLGSLKDLSAADLGGIVISSALHRSGIGGGDVQYVIMGQVLQAGAGQIPARQAAVKAGIPMTVPAITINKVCLSGLDAIALAAQLIRAGEFDIVVAGGMESMTRAPHLLPGVRAGHKYGSMEVLDAMALDGLTDPFDHTPMGELTDAHNKRLGIGRAEQDEFAALSHQRAAAAIKDGMLNEEIVPVPIPQRRGDPVVFDTDEGVRPDTTAESLGRLRPAFA